MNSLSYTKLNESELASALETVPEWAIEGGMLSREFQFESYLAGCAFVAAVGHLAEKLNHHPDIHLYYRRCQIKLETHDAGGLTAYDFELARWIDGIL